MRLQRRPTDALVFVRPDFERLMPATLLPDMPEGPREFIASAGALQRSGLTEDARRELRARYLDGRDTLVVFFGFVYPAKGVELLFRIADPARHALVIAGSVLDAPYRARLEDLARAAGWEGRVHYTGYLEPGPAADLLFAADAVVLPFLAGGGEWNTSIHGALAQGTLVVTTSANPSGDEPARNLYTARIGDVDGMRRALDGLAGRRVAPPADDGWGRIARAHTALYDTVMARGPVK
jgi:glycosyltransferase involved in cell wall biosynthesis